MKRSIPALIDLIQGSVSGPEGPQAVICTELVGCHSSYQPYAACPSSLVATVSPDSRADAANWVAVGAGVTVGMGVLVGGGCVAGAQPVSTAAVPTAPIPMVFNSSRREILCEDIF